MNEMISYLVGFGFCCIIPLVMFGAGVYYAKFGLPFEVHWRGVRSSEEEE